MLQKLLELNDLGNNCFSSTVYQSNFRNALFGGQAVAQALMAAGKTAANLPPHSLHSYFLAPGKADTPIYYHVEIMRDGRSVSTRQVRAIQNNTLIYVMLASFHHSETGYCHSHNPPQYREEPDALRASLSKETLEYLNNHSEMLSLTMLDFVPFSDELVKTDMSKEAHLQYWIRSGHDLNNDPLSHYCALAFASDIGLLGTALMWHDTHLFSGDVTPASMDHSIWFHQQPDFNQWNRYVTKSPWAGGARALCNGEFFDQSDKLVATVAQEGIIRPLSSSR